MDFDLRRIRQNFPALTGRPDGRKPVFLDGPGGAQVPQAVLDAMTGYLGYYNSNLLNGPFFAVQRTHEVVCRARAIAAAFVNAPDPSGIVFGSTMSAITAHMSRSISREWKEGDEIIVTALDHYANVSFWRQAAADRGTVCYQARLHPEDCTPDYDHLESLLSEKTKLVAFGLASNVCGTVTDAARIVRAAKQAGALTYVDAVHYAPHALPDVQMLDCDFLVCSGYKFCGPHIAFLYGKNEHLSHFRPYKVEPAPDSPPDCWEQGTKNFEALAGLSAAIGYLASLGEGGDLRVQLQSAYGRIAAHEQGWGRAFMERAAQAKGLRIYGITATARLSERVPTFALSFEGRGAQEVSDYLAGHDIAAGAGNFYAQGLMEALGLMQGGVLRIGALHYNTLEELERLFALLERLPVS